MSARIDTAARDRGAQKGDLWLPAGRVGVLAGCAVLVGLAVLMLRGWLKDGLPTTAYGETLDELTIIWMFRQELLSGHMLSEWNPYWFSGFPWLRFLSYAVYYPLAALSAWGGLSLAQVMVGYHLSVVALSGLAMFGYLRCVWQDWRVALVGAAIYETWPYHHWLGVETWIHALVWVWVPLTLWAIERHYNSRNRVFYKNSISIGILLGALPVISSEYAVVAGPFLLLYLLARGIGNALSTHRRAGALLGEWVCMGLVALGVSAFFVLPALLEIKYVGIGSKHVAEQMLTPEQLKGYGVTLGLLWYGIASRWGIAGQSTAASLNLASFWNVAWYPGLVAVGLMVLGVVAVVRERRARTANAVQRFAGWAALIGLVLTFLFSTGYNTPYNPFTYVPVLKNIVAVRALLLVGACLAMMAAIGMRWLLQLKCRCLTKQSFALGLVLLAVALIVADHWPSAKVYYTTSSYFTDDETDAYAWLNAHADGESRLWEKVSNSELPFRWFYSLASAPLLRFAGYYDNGATAHTRAQIWTGTPSSTSLRLHLTRYVLLRKSDPTYTTLMSSLREGGYRQAYQNETLTILECRSLGEYASYYRKAVLDVKNSDVTARNILPALIERNIALVAAEAPLLDGLTKADAARYPYVLSKNDSLTSDVVKNWLAKGTSQLIAADELQAVDSVEPGDITAQVLRAGSDRIYVDVSVSHKGLLTIAESWYPCWQVWVDGEAASVVRANGALLGVWLAPGEHRVEFRFVRPWYEYLGFGLTAFTWLVILCMASWQWPRLLQRQKAQMSSIEGRGFGA